MPSPRVKNVNVTISTSSILKVLVVVLGLWLAWVIRDIVAVFFVGVLLAALIEPFTRWFSDRGIPRGIGVLVIYFILFILLVLTVLIVIPPLVDQLTRLIQGLADTYGSARGIFENILDLMDKYGLRDNFIHSLDGVQQGLTRVITGLFSTVANIAGGFVTLTLILVLAFYMVAEEDMVKKAFHHFAPKKYQPYLIGLAHRMQGKLGAWLRGELLLMFIIGLTTYIGLLIVGLEYPLVLGIFAGMAELVPYAGPIISMIPAVIVAFAVSPVKALIVVLLYFGIQQFENSVLTPMVMKKSVGLNPVVSLFAMMVGFKVGGLVGALLAIPVATITAVLLKDL